MEEEPEENPILDHFETELAMRVIRDCITKLEIIGNTLPLPPVPADTRGYQSLEERYVYFLVILNRFIKTTIWRQKVR